MIALLSVSLAMLIHHHLQSMHGKTWRNILWTGIAIPLITPSILIGYVYSQLSLNLVHHPAANEIAYLLLITARLIPAALIVLHFAPPPPVSAQAMHLAKLNFSSHPISLASIIRHLGFILRSPAITKILAFSITFTIAFAEFEIASLMNIRSWTVWLFDAQAGGIDITRSITVALWPLTCELLILIPLLLILLRTGKLPHIPPHQPLHRNPLLTTLTVIITLVSLTAATLYPAVILIRQTFAESLSATTLTNLAKPIAVSSFYAIIATIISCTLAHLLIRLAAKHRWAVPLTIITSAPGLLGSLLLGLTFMVLFTTPILSPLRDSVIPLALALSLLLLPIAVILNLLVAASTNHSSIFIANQLQSTNHLPLQTAGGRLIWQLKIRPTISLAFIIFLIAYFDISASAILTPPSQTPVSIMLYNQMHYGQNTVLSAMLLATIVTTILIFFVSQLLGRTLCHTGVIRG